MAGLVVWRARLVIRVAVAPHARNRGVEAPRFRDRTYDWRRDAGGADNDAKIRAAYQVIELGAALERAYDTDAHLVTYTLAGRNGRALKRQPRINKGGLAWLLEQGYTLTVDALFADVDNPGHKGWDRRLRARFDEQLATLDVLSTCGVYLTRAGYRLIQPLDEPVVVPDVERYLWSWLDELATAGVAADTSCKDWTRHFRLPHVRRGLVQFESPLVDLSRMQPRVVCPKASPGAPGAGGATCDE